jgi:threonine/homoserine/homoserine lactone efflux protein
MVAAFAGVVLLGAMSPGPDFAIVVRRAAISGRAAGTMTALGVAAGIFLWAIAAAAGVATLVAASALAYTIVKLAGAAYLVVLGVRALLAARTGGGAETAPTGDAGTSRSAAFRHGLLCNVFNPKVAVFFVALLPQFLPTRPGVVQTLLLSTVAVLITAAWFTLVANLVGAFRRIFARAAIRRAVDAITGTALVALGLRLAAATRP